MVSVNEVNWIALKARVRDILKTESAIYVEKAGKDETNSNEGKVTVGEEEFYYTKLRSVEIGEPDDYFNLPTPYAFVTHGKPKEPVDKPAGQIIAGVVKSSEHKINLMVVVVADEGSPNKTEIALDILYQKVKERLKAFPYLSDPDSDDRSSSDSSNLATFQHTTFGDDFLIANEDGSKTLSGQMILITARLFTSAS